MLHWAFKWADLPILNRGGEVKFFLDFRIFPLGLSSFGWGAWFPSDKGQSSVHLRSSPLIFAHTSSVIFYANNFNRKCCFSNNYKLILKVNFDNVLQKKLKSDNLSTFSREEKDRFFLWSAVPIEYVQLISDACIKDWINTK